MVDRGEIRERSRRWVGNALVAVAAGVALAGCSGGDEAVGPVPAPTEFTLTPGDIRDSVDLSGVNVAPKPSQLHCRVTGGFWPSDFMGTGLLEVGGRRKKVDPAEYGDEVLVGREIKVGKQIGMLANENGGSRNYLFTAVQGDEAIFPGDFWVRCSLPVKQCVVTDVHPVDYSPSSHQADGSIVKTDIIIKAGSQFNGTVIWNHPDEARIVGGELDGFYIPKTNLEIGDCDAGLLEEHPVGEEVDIEIIGGKYRTCQGNECASKSENKVRSLQ